MIKAMHGNELYRNIPYIVMSSMPEASVRDRLDGYVAFLRKPFTIVTIIELVAAFFAAAKTAH